MSVAAAWRGALPTARRTGAGAAAAAAAGAGARAGLGLRPWAQAGPHRGAPRRPRGARAAAAGGPGGEEPGLEAAIRQKNAESPVVVYSKSWCPFCVRVKDLMVAMGVQAKVVELDQVVEGDEIQAALQGMTGVRTVPQVFVGGAFVGGCDDTMRLNGAGELMPILAEAGALC